MIAEEPRVDATRVTELAQLLETELARLIVGQKALLRDTVIALTAGGHVLLEGVPGLGKTVLPRRSSCSPPSTRSSWRGPIGYRRRGWTGSSSSSSCRFRARATCSRSRGGRPANQLRS